MKASIGNISRRIRAILLMRQADKLLRKASSAYKPSRHLVGYVPPVLSDNEGHQPVRAWIVTAAVIVSFLAGAYLRNDHDSDPSPSARVQIASSCAISNEDDFSSQARGKQ